MNLRNEREARNMIQRDFEKQAKEYSIENQTKKQKEQDRYPFLCIETVQDE